LPTCSSNGEYAQKEIGKRRRKTHLAEQATSSSSLRNREVNVDIVVLSANRLLDERLGHRLAVDEDGVVVDHGELGSRTRLVNANSETVLDLVGDTLVELRSSVTVALETSRSGDTDLVEDLEDDAAVPEDLLEREVVDADGLAELDVGNCGKRKISAIRGSQSGC
jgi:hypothetical protein